MRSVLSHVIFPDGIAISTRSIGAGWPVRWPTVRKLAAASRESFGFFCPRQAVMIVRSDLSDEVSCLHSHTDTWVDGHVRYAPGAFFLTAQGRVWAPYISAMNETPVGSFREGRYHNMLIIDAADCGSTTAKLIDYADSKLATC